MNLSRSWPIYLATVAVFVASFLLAWFLPVSETFKGIATVPGIGAMLAFLTQIWRDQREHERRQELQEREQDFTLGIASHMAAVAYNKHFEFCETYSEKLHDGLQRLLQSGPTETALALELADELKAIRARYTVWLTQEIEDRLFPGEHALRQVGASSRLLESLPVGPERTSVVEQVYNLFGVVIGVNAPMSEEDAERSATRVMESLRRLLGIRQLTALRQRALDAAERRTDHHRE
jgi:hypothetical protein